MVITHKLRVDADCLVVFCTIEEVRVGASQAAIAWVTAGLSAVVRIQVVGASLFSDEGFEVFAVSSVIKVFEYFPGADGLIKYLQIFLFSTSLVESKYTV